MSEHTFPRDDVPERLNFLEPFYFGQPRIPTTYLDGDDFVFGAKEKLITAIKEVMKRNPSIITVINSPGAALIGDNIHQAITESGLAVPCAVIEMPAFSCFLAEGYQQVLIEILQTLSSTPEILEKRTVAIVGLSIAHQHWAGSVAELKRLLELCGIRVLCAIGAGSSLEEYRQIPRAACYAIVHDEYADRIGPWLAERYGGKVVSSDMGAPVGFTATAAWLNAVAQALDADPNPALEDILTQRRRVSRFLNQATGSSAVLKGMTFAIQADPSIAMPLSRWLYEYIGMLPVAVESFDSIETTLSGQLHGWLSEIGCVNAWQMPWYAAQPDLLFADGHQVALAKAMGHCGIEVMLPARACLDIVPKAMLGALGGAWLVEQILRELWWVLWL
jgi:nitrogenase molybdenum-iron protein alpha/beta subunit